MHAKVFNHSYQKENKPIIHIINKQIPSLVQGSPVESPSCHTLSRAQRRGDPSW